MWSHWAGLTILINHWGRLLSPRPRTRRGRSSERVEEMCSRDDSDVLCCCGGKRILLVANKRVPEQGVHGTRHPLSLGSVFALAVWVWEFITPAPVSPRVKRFYCMSSTSTGFLKSFIPFEHSPWLPFCLRKRLHVPWVLVKGSTSTNFLKYISRAKLETWWTRN